MTFRTRLLRSIAGLAIGTTVVSLYIAQTQSTASYLITVDEMFRREATIFQDERQASLDLAQRQAAKLAESVRLFAALEAADESVYEVAAIDLQRSEFAFFRLADAAGRLIPAPIEHDHLSAEANAALMQQLKRLPAHSTKNTPTSIGFIALSGPGMPEVYRVLVSPIFNFDQHVGSLLLAERFQVRHREGSLQSAIQIGNTIFGDALKPEVVARLQHGSTKDYRVASIVLNPGSSLPEASLISGFSLAGFHERQRALTWRIAGTGALAALFGMIVSSGMARQLSEPLRRMVAAAHEIQTGNFDVRLPPDSTQEINTLAQSINEMSAGLALKERYRSVLDLIADAQVADELLKGDIRLGGELRLVSVIFCDIRGYTELTTDMKPVAVLELLNAHMGAMTCIVHEHRGVVHKFAGDGLMILFGAPKAYGDDAIDAVRCAMAMMQERQRLNTSSSKPLRMSVGIATGEVVAGCLGAEKRAEYTVIGERVNLASRLCGGAVADEILVDQTTYELCQQAASHLSFAAVEPLTLKGYSSPMAAWRVEHS